MGKTYSCLFCFFYGKNFTNLKRIVYDWFYCLDYWSGIDHKGRY